MVSPTVGGNLEPWQNILLLEQSEKSWDCLDFYAGTENKILPVKDQDKKGTHT